VVWIGHNRKVAWGAAHARAVTADLFVETRSPSDPQRYHSGSGWRSLSERSETLRARGRPDEILVVRETQNGPLVNHLLGEPDTALSLAWTGAQPGEGVSALLRAAHADTAEEFRRALASHHEPVLSFVFADRNGEAGLQVAGWIPSRPPTALVPVPGRDTSRQWKRGIEFERLPQARLEDQRGWLVAADGPLGLAGEEEIEWTWRTGERASRLEALLLEATKAGPLELRRLARLASDVHTPYARRLIETVGRLAGDATTLGRQEREVLGRLRSWDQEAAAQSVGAGVYEVFLQQLMPELWREALGEELLERYFALPHANPVALVAELLAAAAEGREPPEWTDAARIRAAVLRALRETWIRLSVRVGANPERWEWGRLHLLRFRTLVESRPAPEDSLGPRPYPGDALTVATAEFDRRYPFDVRVASTFRLAADTAALDTVLYSIAPGQSEHPGHRHYADALEPWLEHRLQLLASGPLLIDEVATQRLVLEPGP
jgi:penicillin amidase